MDFDVVIIGSGAGGGMAALRLCERGFKVGLIERGPRFNPKKDYIFNHLDWESRVDPLDKASKEEQTIDRNHRSTVAWRDRRWQRSALIYHRVHGVGGSTLHYQGEAHRFPEHAFNTKQQLGWGIDWPINYHHLAPYYQQAEELLGVAGEPGNPFKPKRGPFPTPAHPLSAKSAFLAEAALKAGMTLQPNTLALPSRSVDGRLPCQHSGTCNYGCVFQAKSSIDQAIIPKAEATGNLTLLTDTRVTQLVLNDKGQVSGVDCIQGTTNIRYTAKRYVLAGGAVETPRLLLASRNAASDKGVGNQHDQVGRYFMETVVARMIVTLPSDIPAYLGPPLDSRIWDYAYPKDNKTNGFVLGAAGYLSQGRGPANHAIRTPGLGRAHKQRVRQSFGTQLYLFGIAEQEPLFSNRVFLSDELDKDGAPKVKVECEYSPRDLHTVEQMEVALKKWADGSKKIKQGHLSNTLSRSSATHVGGTCRMGNTASESVVDAYGKIHSHDNCYITDASVLPTQGAGDSPSLTIQSLALRTADRIAASLNS